MHSESRKLLVNPLKNDGTIFENINFVPFFYFERQSLRKLFFWFQEIVNENVNSEIEVQKM